MIIDAHCHAGLGDGLTGPWDTRAPLAGYLRRADRAGIARTILLPVFHSDYEVANRDLARIVRAGAGRFIGFAMVHPDRDAGRVARLICTAVGEYGFRGIKVHRHDGRISREICEAARAYQLPVLYDVMGETSAVELIATEYPTVTFVIPHLGSFADDWRAHVSVIDQLVRYPNVYADTSGVRRFDFLVEAIRRVGPGKLIYGSDGPFLHPGLELAKVRALGLPPRAERMVTGGTITRLLRLADPAEAHASPRASLHVPILAGPRAIGRARPRARDPWAPTRRAVG
jgi:uncharacterized protein